MLGNKYLDEITGLLANLAETQEATLAAAADLCAEAVSAGGVLHHFDTGHMKEEPIRRAGGLFGLHHLELRLEVDHPLPAGREPELSALAQGYFYDREDLADLVLDKSHLRKGDVLIQVSNSGKEPFTVGVGLGAKERGVRLVALTSIAFSQTLEPAHSSGKRLMDVADVVIDLGAPPGDAVLEVPGMEAPVGATSGVLTAAALWALTCEIVEALRARGIHPAVYKSVNLPDGFAFNRREEARYRENGI